jgi:hypothetical protein
MWASNMIVRKHDLQELQTHGKLVNSGAFAEPFDGGVQIFEDCTKGDVEAYLSRDPCVFRIRDSDFLTAMGTCVIIFSCVRRHGGRPSHTLDSPYC